MSDKAIFGVCSGFAKYFEIDPIVIRLAVVLLALMGTLGVWFYILAAIIMPKDTDIAYAQQPRYDTETGRPLYQAGGNVYENRAAGMNTQDAPVQDVEFTATAYGPAETVSNTEDAADTENAGAETFENTEAQTQASDGSCGDTSGSWTEPKQDPYKNFQGYQSRPQQAQQTQQAQYSAQPEQHSSRRSRNTGILFIIIGVVILAKIILPKVNIWIPISIASIFFGIYLCCRKK